MFTILLVEDNSQDAALTLRILRSSGFDVEHATLASQAIQMTRQHPWSLIIMDLELPDMTGQTACLLIKRQLLDRTPPIIALTTHREGGFRQSARNAGCKAFISKPYSATLLIETVHHFLDDTPVTDHTVLL